MPKLLVFERTYYSPSDESAFYGWLRSIAGVTQVKGVPTGIEVTLRSKVLGEAALRELLALHHRYGLPMRDLAQFKTERNVAWFFNPNAYWYTHVFGPSAVSADVNARLKELREAEASPVGAIKAVRQEYGISLGEAKRLFSIAPAWQRHVEEDRPLQEEIIAVVERTSNASSIGGT